MLLDQPLSEFATLFYGEERLKWRTAVAEALGLLQQQELGDYRFFFFNFCGVLLISSGAPGLTELNYRRIRGVCSYSAASGCLP
jgi:hypothetical protein